MRKRVGFAAGFLCIVSAKTWAQAAQGQGGHTSSPTACLSQLVPLYVYPSAAGSAWNTVLAQPLESSKVQRILIVNPNSGPGVSANADYRKIVMAAQRAGNKVYGYVATAYGKVVERTAEDEIEDFIRWYGVDGIFVDEVSANAAQVPYYQRLATRISSAIQSGGVILNHGAYPDPSYAEIKVSKQARLQLVVFEHDYASFISPSFVVPPWTRKYPPTMFLNIVYATPEKHLGEVLRLSAKRGLGVVYVTDKTLPNPYATLPSYWIHLNQTVQTDCSR